MNSHDSAVGIQTWMACASLLNLLIAISGLSLWCADCGCNFKVILVIIVEIFDVFELAGSNIV